MINTTIYSTADSYVSSNLPDNNFGDTVTLLIKTQTAFNCRGFLKFDLSGLSALAVISLAKLRMNCSSISNLLVDVTDIQARGVADDTWEELAVTWNNQKAYGDVEDTKVPAVGWVEWDVTSFVKAQFAGDKTVSICLRCVQESYDGSNRYAVFSSREGASKPELYIEYYIPDLSDKIQTLIETEWEETNPAIADVKFCTQDYGHDADLELFDTNACYPQIAINTELEETITYVINLTTKIVNSVALLVYLRPANYQLITIGFSQTTFKNIINEIKRIIRENRYLLTDVAEVKISRWKIQTKKKEEPIVFVARIELNATTYEE